MKFSREDSNRMLGYFLYELSNYGLLSDKGITLLNQDDLNIFISSDYKKGLLDEFHSSLNNALDELENEGFVI